MTSTTKKEEPKLHVRRPRNPWAETSTKSPGKAICDEPAAPELLLTDMKFMTLEPNNRYSGCERIQNRAIQTVKLKKGEGTIKPKDLQNIYSRELTPEKVRELDIKATPKPSPELTPESTPESTNERTG